jgi:hypothetical protein
MLKDQKRSDERKGTNGSRPRKQRKAAKNFGLELRCGRNFHCGQNGSYAKLDKPTRRQQSRVYPWFSY